MEHKVEGQTFRPKRCSFESMKFASSAGHHIIVDVPPLLPAAAKPRAWPAHRVAAVSLDMPHRHAFGWQTPGCSVSSTRLVQLDKRMQPVLLAPSDLLGAHSTCRCQAVHLSATPASGCCEPKPTARFKLLQSYSSPTH